MLVDCLTLWLSNLMLSGADLDEAADELVRTLEDFAPPVVFVSNEVGLGVEPKRYDPFVDDVDMRQLQQRPLRPGALEPGHEIAVLLAAGRHDEPSAAVIDTEPATSLMVQFAPEPTLT